MSQKYTAEEVHAALEAWKQEHKKLNDSMDSIRCFAAAPSVPAESAQPSDRCRMAVGMAGTMPGTDVFTVAFFKASDVPVGTELYTHPAVPAAAPSAPEGDGSVS